MSRRFSILFYVLLVWTVVSIVLLSGNVCVLELSACFYRDCGVRHAFYWFSGLDQGIGALYVSAKKFCTVGCLGYAIIDTLSHMRHK